MFAEVLANYKQQKGCSACGATPEPQHLHFHHRDRATKEFTIATAVKRGHPQSLIWQEIAKCDLLCNKCHNEAHKREQQAVYAAIKAARDNAWDRLMQN